MKAEDPADMHRLFADAFNARDLEALMTPTSPKRSWSHGRPTRHGPRHDPASPCRLSRRLPERSS